MVMSRGKLSGSGNFNGEVEEFRDFVDRLIWWILPCQVGNGCGLTPGKSPLGRELTIS